LPFLRRPLSLHDVTPPAGTVAVLFRVKGPGTKALAGVRPGDRLDVIGPLGRGVFPLAGDRPAIIVGGGLGVAPLFFLARRLVLEGDRCDGGKVAVLIGVRGEPDLALVEPFRVFGQEVELEVATEDASPGTAPGLVTDLLETALKRAALRWARRPAIYACGPQPMLAAVRRLAEKAGAPAWFSVEERMACGVGACRGCAVAVRGSPPFRLACVDGPVFEARDLELGEDTPGGAWRGGGPS
jgi:dihydroorotate dehydrogenase electron transfer subunit